MSLFIAMFIFSLAMSLSPGPVNFVTLSTGLNHGFTKTVPFVAGATVGFTALLVAVGLGLAQLLAQIPNAITSLSLLGTGFLIYVGYKIARASGRIETDSNHIARFHDGFLLQWLNPKAWSACLAGIASFKLTEATDDLLFFCSLYFLVCFASISAWAIAGSKLRTVQNNPTLMRAINVALGSGLILIAVYLQFHQADSLLKDVLAPSPQVAESVGGRPNGHPL